MPSFEQMQRVSRWRLDPEDSFSDCVINVVEVTTSSDEEEEEAEAVIVEPTAGNTSSVTPYHVHKCFLATGDMCSEFFVRLLKSPRGYSENESASCRMPLHPLAAKAFPQLLDYMYTPEQPLIIDTATATALYHLGKYLQIERLTLEANCFIQRDLSFDNTPTYLQHAAALNCENVNGFVADFLGINLSKLNPMSALVRQVEPAVWVAALESVLPFYTEHWSKVVSEISEAHILDKVTFDILTNAVKMPRIDPSVSLTLCRSEDLVNVGTDERAGEAVLSSLQNRCATALSAGWLDLCDPDESTWETLSQRKGLFLPDLLVKSLRHSKLALEKAFEESDKAKMELDATKKKLSEAKKVLSKFKPLSAADVLGRDKRNVVDVPRELRDQNPSMTESTIMVQIRDLAWYVQPAFYYDRDTL